MVTITRVVSKNFVVDIWARIQNFFGLNLKGYERMVEKGINQIESELEERGLTLKWYRYEISQLTNGAMVIMLYGEKK